MYITKKYFRVLSPILYGFALHFLILIIPNSFDYLKEDYILRDSFWVILLMFIFLEINLLLILFLDKKVSLKEKVILRIFIQVALSILLAIILAQILISYEFHDILKKLITHLDEGDSLTDLLASIYLRIFILFVIMASLHNLVFFAIKFFKLNQEKALEAENLRKETIVNQLDILKNQIQPEFWFASLEKLIKLVHENPQKAESFIKKLSLFYRHSLNHNKQELISLGEELEFLEIYLYLINAQNTQDISLSKLANLRTLQKLVSFRVIQKLVEDFTKNNQSISQKIYILFEDFDNQLEMSFSRENQAIHLDKNAFKSIVELNQVLEYYTDKKIEIQAEKIVIPLLELSTNH